MNSKNVNIVFITVLVIWGAIGFYFWEKFLNEHYLGTYDEYGLPIQQSYPGFSFFYHAWPLWAFPLITLLLLLGFWLYLSFAKKKREIQKLTNDLYALEIKMNGFKYEIKTQHTLFDNLQQEYLLKAQNEKTLKIREFKELNDSNQRFQEENHRLTETYKKIEQELFALQFDYHKSLEFTEKLLNRLQQKPELF